MNGYPTRRQAICYPYLSQGINFRNADDASCVTSGVARTDYAANCGDYYYDVTPVNSALNAMTDAENNGVITSTARRLFADVAKNTSGVLYCASMIRISDIPDGTSNTYLLGEKYINSDTYITGEDAGDNEALFVGHDWDNERWTTWAPSVDIPGITSWGVFGGAHSTGFHMAMCDGSVQQMSYSIEAEVHRCLGNRKDGAAIDAKKL